MSPSSLLLFALVFGLACASPGPAIAALVARVLGRGTAGATSMCAGLLIGDLIWLACAVFGLALLAATMQPLFLLLKWAGVLYLLWLAFKLWTAPAEDSLNAAPTRGDGGRLLFAGLAIALANPKTMLFYMALLPTLIDVQDAGAAGFGQLSAVVTLVYGAVLAGYVMLAARARRLFSSPRARRRLNRGTGAVMGGAALAIATR
jgi:threonine/homoserine/homoserine lactone efflux protein